MSSPEPPAVTPVDRPPPRAPAPFTRLLPTGDPATAGELVDAIDLPAHGRSLAQRPYVVLNMVATVDGRATQVDVTFPLSAWDGVSDIPLACGDGDDYPAGSAPLASKAVLVKEHCDPAVREPFIAALSAT